VIQLLNGLMYGGMLYMMAAGLVLIFGLRHVVNFAHGALFALGAYLLLTGVAHGSFWLGLLLAPACLAVIGLLLDRFVLQQLRHRDPMVTVLVTFGLLLISESVMMTVWGKQLRSVRLPEVLSGSVSLFGSPYPTYRLLMVGISLATAALLWAWLRFTTTGLHIRAAGQDPATTAMQGVDTNRLSLIVVGVGAGLAGLAGAVAAPLLALSPNMGSSVLIDAFVVVVVGGLGSFGGAFVAALVIGLVHEYGVVHLPTLATMLPFALMAAVLLWRPQGLAGKAA